MSIESHLRYFESLKKAQAEQQKAVDKAHAARDKYLLDERSMSRDVAYMGRQLLSTKALKSSKVSGDLAPHIAIDEAFADDDPLKGITSEVMNVATQLEGSKDLGDISGRKVVKRVFQHALARRLHDAHRYKLKQETSPFGKETGALPGYEEFKQEWDATEGKKDWSEYYAGLTPKGMATGLMTMGGMNIAAEGVGRVARRAGLRGIAKLAGRGLFALPPVGAAGFVTKGAGLALMAAADWAAFEAGSAVVSESEWGKARQDEPWKLMAAEMALGGGAAMGANKAMKRLMTAKTAEKAATLQLEHKPTTTALMKYKRSTDLVSKEQRGMEGTFEIFDHGNKKDAVRALSGSPLNPVLENSIFTPKPMLEAPKVIPPSLQLPAPIEEAIGSTMSHKGRMAMRTFYEHHANARMGAELMTGGAIRATDGTTNLSPASLDALHKHFAWRPNRPISSKMFPPEERPIIAEINKNLRHTKDTVGTATSQAMSYGLEGKSWQVQAGFLDAPGIEEVKVLAAEGVPVEIGTSLAAAKSQARNVRKTVAKETKRDADIVTATKKDEATLSNATQKFMAFRAAKQSKATTDESVKSITLSSAEETKLLSGGAELSRVPKSIGALHTKKQVGKFKDADLPIDILAEGLRAHPEFATRGPVVSRIVEQMRLKSPGSSTVRGSTVNEIVKAARDMKDIYGKPLLRQRSALSKADASEAAKVLEEQQLLKELVDAQPTHRGHIWKGLAVIPVASIGLLAASGEEAEAGILSKTSVLAAEAAKGAEKMIKEISKTNLIAEKGNVAGQVSKWMDGDLGIDKTAKAIKKNHTRVWSFLRNHVMTPSAVADLFYEAGHSPSVELAARMTAVHNNSQMHRQAVDEILSMVPGYKDVSTEIRKAMQPLQAKFEVPITQASYHENMLKGFRKDLKKTSKKKNPEFYKALEDSIAKSEQELKDAKTALKGYTREWEATVKPLAAKHSSTRISLALEDTAEFKYYPWLKEMLDPDELAAVSKLKDLNKVTAGRIKNAGGDVIEHRPFAHHAVHPDSDFNKIKRALGVSTTNEQDALAYARLHSRSIGSRMMMPDVNYMYGRYIPDVERRIQIMKFWKKGEVGGWDAHRKELKKLGLMSGQLKEFWNMIDDGFKPPVQTKASEWARRYYSLEVLRLLFLSPSVGFKHLMKQTGNIAMFGESAIKGWKDTGKPFVEATRLKVNDRWPTMFPDEKFNPSEAAKFLKAVTNQGKYQSAIAELDILDAPMNRFDNVLSHFNETGSVIVGTVENWDRAATVMMGMEMAAKKGLTPSQATYAMYDSIIRANFLSGPMNPKWIRDPYARAFFMFQGTPYKLMEQRIIRAMKAGKDIKKAFGITLDELKQAKNYAKEGEFRVKTGLIMDALTETKDAYGTPVTKQFMVNMLTLGGLIGAGDYLWDAELADHVIHPPFFKPGSSGVGLALNPAISAGYKAWHHRHEEDSEMLFTEFFNKWTSSTGPFPSTFRKTLRLSQDDIPEIYQGDPWKYIFAVPAKHE